MRPKPPGTAFGRRPPINFELNHADLDEKTKKELDGLSQIGRDLSVL